RPGGPIDIAVGLAALIPTAIALVGVIWPPVAHGDRGFTAMTWLAAGCLLVLIPSTADVSGQIGGRGVQTLLPSVEAGYPWVLGLFGTCLFTGFGIARRRLGRWPTCTGWRTSRRRRSWASAARRRSGTRTGFATRRWRGGGRPRRRSATTTWT